MKKGYYSCDGGTIAVYCGGSIIRYSNGYGDGDFKAYLFESDQEFLEYKQEHLEKYGIEENDYRFISTAYFKDAKVLDYDCYKPKYFEDDNYKESVIFELNGYYIIYKNYGKVYFIKYKD